MCIEQPVISLADPAWLFCRSAPCARQADGAVKPGAAVAHWVRSYNERESQNQSGLSVGAHPVRDKPTER